MQWVRLDTAFPRNHKVLELLSEKDGHRAVVTYICGLAHAGEQDQVGFIPRSALGLCHGRARDAQRLVDVGLWIDDVGGWLINDWDEYQPSSEEAEKRSNKARLAARKRWENIPLKAVPE